MRELTDQQAEYIRKLLSRVPKSEIQLQSKCAELLYWFYPNDWKRLVCVNNNSLKANTQGVGIVPGASDTYWLESMGNIIFIEFKFGNNTQSEKQLQWEQLCLSLGHKYMLCYTEDKFWELINLPKPELSNIFI